jgi:hypothetical protein
VVATGGKPDLPPLPPRVNCVTHPTTRTASVKPALTLPCSTTISRGIYRDVKIIRNMLAAVAAISLHGPDRIIPARGDGFSVDTVGMAQYKLFPCARYALIFLPALAGASNDATFTASPLPDFLIPATIPFQEASLHGYDNGVEHALMCVTLAAGSNVITYEINAKADGWTPTGKARGCKSLPCFWIKPP